MNKEMDEDEWAVLQSAKRTGDTRYTKRPGQPNFIDDATNIETVEQLVVARNLLTEALAVIAVIDQSDNASNFTAEAVRLIGDGYFKLVRELEARRIHAARGRGWAMRNDPPLECPACGRRVRRRDTLASHLHSSHRMTSTSAATMADLVAGYARELALSVSRPSLKLPASVDVSSRYGATERGVFLRLTRRQVLGMIGGIIALARNGRLTPDVAAEGIRRCRDAIRKLDARTSGRKGGGHAR
jgi:hypothetical protein